MTSPKTSELQLGKLLIQHLSPDNPHIENWEQGVIWHGVDELVIELGTAHWYGQGGLINQLYPLEHIAQYPAPFLTSDNGRTGHNAILHPFWWTSEGMGILVEGDRLETSFNAPLSGQPYEHSFDTPAPFDERPLCTKDIESDHLLKIRGENLSIRFFMLSNAREVVEAFWQLIEISAAPPTEYIRKTLWTTWAHFKNHISQEKVLDFAHKIEEYGFNCGMLGIDAKWQDEFGSTRFDTSKFPDPAAMIEDLHQLGMKVTLWAIPFFDPASQHYQEAIERGYVLKQQDGSPYIARWWEGSAAFLDVTSTEAMTWHLDNLQRLAESVNLDGFKFDAGEGFFYNNPAIHLETPANNANHLYVEALAKRYPWSDVRSGWRNQSAPMLFRQWDKSTGWGLDNGLASCISQAIMLNMLGYPYHFPDMIGGNQYATKPTAELMIRWTQAVAPMPIIQFSIPPWEFGEECATICAHYARLHEELADYTLRLLDHPQPIVRPLWWIAPHDETALTCYDSYLIGDDLLVAPVITEEARQRDIYLPAGTWQSYWNHTEVYNGEQWLKDYPAALDTLPLFQRLR